MELFKIEQLIEKYENAETSLQEEQLLRDYFSSHDIPLHLEAYKNMFSYFNEGKTERYTKTLSLTNKPFNWKWLSVAAAIVLMVSIYTYQNRPDNITTQEQKEAQLAYQQTQEALLMVSKKMNKGESIAISGLGEFEKAQNKVFKNSND